MQNIIIYMTCFFACEGYEVAYKEDKDGTWESPGNLNVVD